MKAARPWIMRACAAAALTSLVLEFGFSLPPTLLRALHAIDLGVVLLFAMDVLAGLVPSRDRKAYLRSHWLQLSLVGLLVVQTLGAMAVAHGSALVRIYIVGAQVYLVASVLLAAARANDRLTSKAIRPSFLLLGSFLLLILLGTALLMTPLARTRPWTLVDAVFTATSAACVTGLNVRDIGGDLSIRGQAIVLALIQIGGLGLVTLAMFVTVLSRRTLRVQQMTIVRELISVQVLGDLGRLLAYTLAIAFLAELVGAALLFVAREDLELGPRAWWSVFHSVSAFCNAGFGLEHDSLARWAGKPRIVGTVCFLIIAGGLGFPVILDLLRFELTSLSFVRRWAWRPAPRTQRPRSRLNLHTKLVLCTSASLIAGGAMLFYVSEAPHALDGRPAGEVAWICVFQSVAARTAGFNTVDIAQLQLPTLLLLMILMAVGASPASTGGGIKTSTAAILALTVRSMMRNRDHVEAFGRTIPRAAVNASVAIAALYGLAVCAAATVLLATQPNVTFRDALFESVSALSTVGFSTGLTPKLNDVGKLALCAAMLVGRVGPLAILWTVLARPPALRYEYPEEGIVVS